MKRPSAATLAALTLSFAFPALAQLTPPDPPGQQKPVPSPQQSPAEKPPITSPQQPSQRTAPPPQPSNAAKTEAASTGALDGLIVMQGQDSILASALKGVDVYGPDQKKIGTINDLILKTDGSVEGFVVGVGGFLGIGEKSVALRLARFQMSPKKDGHVHVALDVTKEELEKAPDFKSRATQESDRKMEQQRQQLPSQPNRTQPKP